MKRIALVLMLGILWGCSASVMETEEVIVETEVSVLVLTYVEGLEASLERFLNRPFEVVRSLDGIDLLDYERVLVLYDDNLRRVFPPFTLYGPRLDYPNVVTYTNPDGIDVTMMYLENKDDYLEMFDQIDHRIFQIREPQIIYELYPLSGTVVHVDVAEFDEQLLLKELPLGATIAPKGNNLRWFYTSQDVYLFLGNQFPAYLAAYADQIRSLNEGATVIHTKRGQRLIIGRAIGQNAGLSYQLFVDAVASGIKETIALTPPPPPVIPIQEGIYEICQVPHDNRLRNDYWEMIMGFPRPPRRLPHDRNIKAKIIFVEFPNYPATQTIEELNEFFENRYVQLTNDYIGAMSYGRVQHEFYYHDQIILTELPRRSGPLPIGEDYVSEFVRNTLSIVDEQIDFSPYDYVIFHTDPSLPLNVANFAWANMARENRGYITETNVFYNMNAWSGETVRPGHEWVGVHEIMHLYGLPDYYSRPENVWRGDEWVGNFDIMSNALGANKELLLWSRWYIGWVTPNDIDCLDARGGLETTEHVLSPTMGDEGTKGVIIRVSQFELILIERKDANPYCMDCRGGLIVTTYSSSIPAVYGQLKIVRPEGSTHPNFIDAFLTQGDAMNVSGVRIEVLEQTPSHSIIRISNS
jgi:M6 family metalloprotease-like protein